MTKTRSGKKSSKPRRKLPTKCAGHANHMCELSNRREMGKLAKGAVHVRYVCGRAAVKPANLCDPILI